MHLRSYQTVASGESRTIRSTRVKAVEKEGRGIFRYMYADGAASIPTRAGGRLTRAIEAGNAAYLYASGDIEMGFYKAGTARNSCGPGRTVDGRYGGGVLGAERTWQMQHAGRQGGEDDLTRGGRAPCRAPRAADARLPGGQVDGRQAGLTAPGWLGLLSA